MLLDRLRVRGKLLTLVIAPLVAVIALSATIAVDRSSAAKEISRTAAAAETAGVVGELIAEVEEERLLAVGILVDVVERAELIEQFVIVDDVAFEARRALEPSLDPALRSAIETIEDLTALRTRALSVTATAEEVFTGYTRVNAALLDALALTADVNATTSSGRELATLDALMRMNEANSQKVTLLAIAAGNGDEWALHHYLTSQAEADAAATRFVMFATGQERGLYDRIVRAYTDRVGSGFVAAMQSDPTAALRSLSLPRVYSQLESFIVLGRFAERTVIGEVNAAVAVERQRQLIVATVAIGLAVIIPLLVVGIGVAIATNVAGSLIRLTTSADRVAKAAEEELARVADDEQDSAEPLRLDRVQTVARDEIGELARAFDRIQVTAAGLVERQVLSRRNVAQMFGHIGRRTQNLVGRQLDLIDELEYRETDPDRLSELYRLDHISSRLRRSASSLVVLSGTTHSGQYRGPLPLRDVVRLALGEIEQYTRVDVEVPATMTVAPAMISDLVLMLAELMENATVFSPPQTRVAVSARPSPAGTRITVVDHGIGLSTERLAAENARLARRERLDLAPTEVLGLLVVGRLARRHGAAVRLSATPGGGITATVEFGHSLLVGSPLAMAAAVGSSPPVRSAGVPRPSVADLPSGGLVDMAALERATRTVQSGQTWNAFAPAAPPAPAVRAGLRQRVPGAQLPLAPAVAASSAAVASDAPAVRQLVEAFEGGVRRAQEQAPPGRAAKLTRRVPGATIADTERALARPAGVPEADPELARQKIQNIEYGVARAQDQMRAERNQTHTEGIYR